MSKKDTNAILEELLSESARLLLERVKNGSATAADLNAARALLKDNAITAVPVKGTPLGGLADALPNLDDDEATEQMGLTH